MARRSVAKPVRLTCPKCMAMFTVVACISQGVDKGQYYKDKAAQHDCEAQANKLAGKAFRNPLKVSKSMAKGK